MKLETNMVQTITQKQILSLHQQQALKILAMNDLQVLREMRQASESNPLLELDDLVFQSSNCADVFEHASNMLSQTQTLQDVLLEQLHMCRDDIPFELGEFLIESLDSNGYLQYSNQELAQLTHYDEECIEDSLALLQQFEPYGVFARNLQECLLIQLCVEDVPYSQVAIIIVNYYLKELANNQIKRISEQLDISIDEVYKATTLIRSLAPKPGSNYAKSAMIQNPDAKISIQEGALHIEMPSYEHHMHISSAYANMENEVVLAYLQKHTQQAQIFIDSLQKRHATLSAILLFICEHQKAYFMEHGELQPLTLQEIAQALQLHESTISRGISQKFIEFEDRYISLKTFFPSRLDSGESSSAIHDRIRKLIMEENHQKPLSDQQIAKQLTSQKITISRRTVAKYREQMKLPAATRRKLYQEEKEHDREK